MKIGIEGMMIGLGKRSPENMFRQNAYLEDTGKQKCFESVSINSSSTASTNYCNDLSSYIKGIMMGLGKRNLLLDKLKLKPTHILTGKHL